MPTYGLLISGGIDSKVLAHMYPDAIKYHYLHQSDVDMSGDSGVTSFDISSYDQKHEGMGAKTVALLADANEGLDNIMYGVHLRYDEIADLPSAPIEGTNTLLKPLENMYKHDIIKYAANNNIDLRDTVSCLNEQTHTGCGYCYQCREKSIALEKLDSEGFDYSNVI
jgi:7-cyano-7-deazaguanine synthase in queuosine biosynthesis